jgi:transketolase
MNLKQEIIQISKELGLIHISSNLTAVDIISKIYSIKKEDEPFILSAGHAHLAHLLVKVGYTTAIDLIQKYGIHCDRKAVCDVSTGSLGHGLGIAIGMALSDRKRNVYCLLTDGECSEGSIFEGLRIAQEQKLKNLKVYLNANGFGAYKSIDLNRLKKQISGFGFPVKFVKTDVGKYLKFKGLQGHYVKA